MARRSAGAVVALSEIERDEILDAIDDGSESQVELASGDTVDLPLAKLYNKAQLELEATLNQMKESLRGGLADQDLYLRLNDALLTLQHWSDDIIVQNESPLTTIENDTVRFKALVARLRGQFNDILRVLTQLHAHTDNSTSEFECVGHHHNLILQSIKLNETTLTEQLRIKSEDQAIQSLKQLINHLKVFVHPLRTFLEAKINVGKVAAVSKAAAAQDAEDGAIHVAREAIEATPEDHPERASRLNNLGVLLNKRYSYTGSMEDLEEAIGVAHEAVKATPEGHSDRAGWLNNLGNQLGDRYSRTGSVEDLEEAIGVTREAVKSTPEGHSDRARWLNNLGSRLGKRYSRTGSVDDLEEAINVTREAVKATPIGHSKRAGQLNNLGILLRKRHSRTGSMDDLEEALGVTREAVKATPKGHPDRAKWLNNLGNQLEDRYSCTGSMEDLEEAIHIAQEAVKSTPEGHPDRAEWLNNLGSRLGKRYSQTGSVDDLEEAINVTREAVKATPIGHPKRAGQLNNLGLLLGNRHSRTGWMEDLEEAVGAAREAVTAIPKVHPDRAVPLNTLGILLGNKYLCTGSMGDLEEAIDLVQEAIQATPEGHPDQAKWLINLGLQHKYRYSRIGSMNDLEEARRCFNVALNHPECRINTRITAGRQLLSLLDILQEGHRAYVVAKTTVELVPLLAPPSLQNIDKQHLLSQAVGLASDAAAIALHVGKGPVPVIELLETGRGVLASSLQDMRTDLSTLQQQYPELARSFVELRDQLDPPPSQGTLVTDESTRIAPGTEADWRHKASNQMPLLLKQIRGKPGFERFLLSASEAEMREAAVQGPIVILNVSSHRCDALIVEQSRTRVLELSRLSRQDILDRAEDVQSLETLAWLWDTIVSPILDALGFNKPLSGDSWPHVWWIPTGPLVRFPLHAAGHHLEPSSDTALDRAVSSYSSSIKAILHSRQQRAKETTTGSSTNVVLIAMQDTPEQKPLQYASDETSAVQAVCEFMGLPHVQPRPYKKEVSLALEACRIFHFAGHGDANEENPLASLLLLEDWKEDPLTVGSLLETNLSSRSPFLAYLSACGTGQIRHEKSVDESIHLTSAFQLAGFRHVVGTLWEVDDGLCVQMARLTYQFLRDNGISDRSVSSGLHYATRQLRDDWVHQRGNGQRQESGGGEVIQDSVPARVIEKCESMEASRPLWVPYVHYGV